MYLELPLEQIVRHRGRGTQLPFAAEAMERVPARKDFALTSSPLGLHVLAGNEDALALPLRALRKEYGAALQIAQPRARLIKGQRTEEPIMHVEIRVEGRHKAKVHTAMTRRRAKAVAEFGRIVSVLRYEAPLARLLGLAKELARLTHGTARHWIALSHYTSVKRRCHDSP